MDENGYSNAHPIDISDMKDRFPILIDFPPRALRRCNRLIVAMLAGTDIRKELDAGVSADGITEGCPFFTPLVWNALIHAGCWEEERKNIEIMLDYPIDCNKIGRCGFNLYHIHLARACVVGDASRLEWWIRHPMVDIDAHFLDLSRRTFVHPTVIPLPREVKALLLSRGASASYIRDLEDYDFTTLMDRLLTQWDTHPKGLKTAIRHRHCCTRRSDRIRKDARLTPTPLLNDLRDIPSSHVLYYHSPVSGLFAFHCSYLEIITRTHMFPFTQERIPPVQVREWMRQVREDGVFPREEMNLPDITREYPIFLNHEPPVIPMYLQWINEWLIPVYPYTRIMTILKFSWDRPKVYQYLCSEMSRGEFVFPSFPLKPRSDDWEKSFFWGSYEALDGDGFIYARRLENLILRMEMLEFIEKKGNDRFHVLFPASRVFIDSEPQSIQFYQHEYNASIFQVYYLLRNLSLFLSSSI